MAFDTAKRMSVTTTIEIEAAAAAVWVRLCDADMPATAPCEFSLGRFGPPRPLRCELPEGVGGVGAARRCVTDRGVVEQRVTDWVVNTRLAFEVVAENSGLGPHVIAMRDVFDLRPIVGGVQLTRRTELVPRGPCPRLRGVALKLAVRRVHRYTMQGFKAAAEAV